MQTVARRRGSVTINKVMPIDALVVLGTGLSAILAGFLFGAGAPAALTVAYDRVRERGHKRAGSRAHRSRYPYR